jgi:hypothetical protein
MDSQNSAGTVKLQYDGEIRKVTCVSSYEELIDTILQIYKFETASTKFSYTDEDGDSISISNEEDMKECFNYFAKKTPKI